MPNEILHLMVGVFGAVADPTGAPSHYALTKRSMCVRDLAILTGVSESAVSHQLRFLRDRRLVKSSRTGTVIRYALDNHHVAALFREAGYHTDHIRRDLPDRPYPSETARRRLFSSLSGQ